MKSEAAAQEFWMMKKDLEICEKIKTVHLKIFTLKF